MKIQCTKKLLLFDCYADLWGCCHSLQYALGFRMGGEICESGYGSELCL